MENPSLLELGSSSTSDLLVSTNRLPIVPRSPDPTVPGDFTNRMVWKG